jgi:hypothetical protein
VASSAVKRSGDVAVFPPMQLSPRDLCGRDLNSRFLVQLYDDNNGSPTVSVAETTLHDLTGALLTRVSAL